MANTCCFLKKKKKKKKSCENTGQPNPTRNLIDLNPFLTHLKWFILTRNPIDLTRTRPFYHIYPHLYLLLLLLFFFFSPSNCHITALKPHSCFLGANIPYDFPTIRNMKLTWNFLAFESQSNLYNISLSLNARLAFLAIMRWRHLWLPRELCFEVDPPCPSMGLASSLVSPLTAHLVGFLCPLWT